MAADLLVIGSVEAACFDYLKTGLTLGNCVKRFVLADAKPSWHKLATHLAHYIRLHFDQLRKGTTLYQMLNADQFGRILAGESLNVQKEEQV